ILLGQEVGFGVLSFVLAFEGSDHSEGEPETDQGSDVRKPDSSLSAPTVEVLSGAQRRVFNLLLSGKTEKTIAHYLDLSHHTVHNHVRAIFEAFEVHSRPELLARVLPQKRLTVSCPGPVILIADDNDAVRRLLTVVLKPKGFTVFAAATGVEALEFY